MRRPQLADMGGVDVPTTESVLFAPMFTELSNSERFISPP